MSSFTNDLLLKAADLGFTNTVKNLLDSSLNINVNHQHSKDSRSGYNRGVDALMLAARSGHADLVEYLLSYSSATSPPVVVDPARKDAEQWTSLHYAAFSGHDAICKMLVATNKCDLTLRTQFEKATAEDFATHRKFREAAQVVQGKNSVKKNNEKHENADDNNKTNTDSPNWTWSTAERIANVEKCLSKLRQSCPFLEAITNAKNPKAHIPKRAKQQFESNQVIPQPFLFRYEMTLGNFQNLESFLMRNAEPVENDGDADANAAIVGDRTFVVLDAVDLLLHREKDVAPMIEILKMASKMESETEEHSQHEVYSQNSIDFLLGANDDKNAPLQPNAVNYLPVKIIVHCDFAAHKTLTADFIRRKNDCRCGWRMLRSSSINGLEHIIVVAKF